MKVTVLQENLARGLSTVSRAVSSRSTLPVLSNILIATDEGRLRLSATNLELGITCWIPARIDENGSTTVPSRTFNDLVNTLPGDQVQLNLDVKSQTLHVKGGSSNNDIKGIDAQEFPPMPTPEMKDAVQLNVFPQNPGAKKCYEKVGFKERTLTENAFRFKDESWGRCNMVIKR